jgi:thymidylate kinase
VKELIENLFKHLENKSIQYTVLRKFELTDGDIDILFFNDDLEKLEVIMKNYNAIKVNSSLYTPHTQYHIPYIENNIVKYFIIDCIVDFIFGKNMNSIDVILNKDDFISTLQKIDGYFMPSYEYLTIFLSIHIFIENKSSSNDKRFSELSNYFKKSDKTKLQHILSKLTINNQIVNELTINTLEKNFKTIEVQNKNIKFLSLKVISFLKRKIFIRRGIIVSFIGVDGTGKSTLSDGVCDILKINTDKVVKTVYLGDIKSSKKVERLKGNYRDKINKKGFMFKIYKVITLTIYFLKRLFLSLRYYHQSREQFILSDRFILDRLIPSPNTKKINKINIFALKLFKNFIKLPDIIYFLDGDAKKISDRKAEYSYEDTLNGMKFQKEVLDKTNLNYNILNTTENTIKEVKTKVLIEICNKQRDEIFNA